MKKKNILTALCTMALFAMGTTSCSNEDPLPEQENGNLLHTCNLIFEGDIETFDAQTRAAEWENNDTVFLLLNNGDNPLAAQAIYNAATAKWAIHYYGNLADTGSGKCMASHFDDIANPDGTGININCGISSIAYIDSFATYSKTPDEIKVKAHLKPISGRLRFKGSPGTTFKLHGVRRIARFNTNKFEIKTTLEAEKMLVGSNGYTPYIYGTPDEFKNRLWLEYEEESYALQIPNGFLDVGKSGFLDVPTADVYTGWRRSKDKPFTVNGVCFIMKFVEGGTFTMGGTPDQEPNVQADELPTHKVTLSGFWIGETEVTNKLWNALIMDGTSNDLVPKSRLTWDNSNTFIRKLSGLTDASFSLPTEAQWEYAARGGKASSHYKYSGSDDVDEVAHYKGAGLRIVATKSPNELGIYDMSGNVYEYCSDWYGQYTAEDQTDPTGPDTGSERVRRGGHCFDRGSSIDDCRVADRRDGMAPNYGEYGRNNGFRLALPANKPKTK